MDKELQVSIIKNFINADLVEMTDLVVFDMFTKEPDKEYLRIKKEYPSNYKLMDRMGWVGMASHIKKNKYLLAINMYLFNLVTKDKYSICEFISFAFENLNDDYIEKYYKEILFLTMFIHEYRHIDMFYSDMEFHKFHTEYNVEVYARMCVKELIKNNFDMSPITELLDKYNIDGRL